MALTDILNELITKEGTLTDNPVAPFAYSSTAFTNDDADGHSDYDVARENNIPLADAEVLDVNGTVLAKGFRSQASSLTRMLMNHFFGRVSYNLNKTVDVINSLLSSLNSALGVANGIAMLDSTGKISSSQIPSSLVTSVNGVSTENNAVTITGEEINVSSSDSTKINVALSTLQSNIDAEATARANADTTQQGEIDTLESGLSSEATSRENGDIEQYENLVECCSKMFHGKSELYLKSGSTKDIQFKVPTTFTVFDEPNISTLKGKNVTAYINCKASVVFGSSSGSQSITNIVQAVLGVYINSSGTITIYAPILLEDFTVTASVAVSNGYYVFTLSFYCATAEAATSPSYSFSDLADVYVQANALDYNA